MKKAIVTAILIVAVAGSAYGASIRTAEPGFYSRTPQAAQDICVIDYANYCSGWIYVWSGFNGILFEDLPSQQRPPAKIGVCFDLNDCEPGCKDCHELAGLVWAWKRYTTYGRIDVEIFCADEECCPVGPALAGIYDFHVDYSTAWQVLSFEALDLPCETCRFIAMATIKTPEDCLPYSDANDKNRENGCEPEWRCWGHSYVYRHMELYCSVEGVPAPLTIAMPGACVPQDRIREEFWCEWLCRAYVNCEGQVATEKNTWSKIKAFYR